MEAEREAVSMYRAYLVRDQIGEKFTGTVSAVTSFGAFVEIDEPYVEGLIKKDSLGDDVEFDEIHMRLRARRSGMTLTLGDSVQVEIGDVSVIRRRIELKLVAVRRVTAAKGADLATADDYGQEAAPATRVGIGARRKAGRAAVEALVGAKPDRRRVEKAGKLRVSHRRDRDLDGPPAKKAKFQKPKKRR
jgi:ribonuclease R